MIINITAKQDFNAALQTIKELKSILEKSQYNIFLNFLDPHANTVITSQTITSFMENLSTTLNYEVEFDLEGISNLSTQTIKTLLNNEVFANQIGIYSFKVLCLSSDEIAEYVLTQPHLKNKLNNYMADIDSQTFSSSCAARSIMRFLWEENLISPDEYTRSKEFEIYQQIWMEPGKIADPIKIVDYCKKNNIQVMGIEFDQIIEEKLSPDSEKNEAHRESHLMNLLGLFRYATQDNNIRIQSSDYENLFNKSSLLVLRREEHVEFVKKNSDGKIEVIDTNGDKTTYNSAAEFVSQDPEFSGVGFSLKLNEHP